MVKKYSLDLPLEYDRRELVGESIGDYDPKKSGEQLYRFIIELPHSTVRELFTILKERERSFQK